MEKIPKGVQGDEKVRVRTTEIKLGTMEDLKKEVLKEGKGRDGRHVINQNIIYFY